MPGTDHRVTSIAQLEEIYGQPAGASMWKEIDHVSAEYRAFIEAAPFFALASNGPEGIDCSPRGDDPGFVRVVDRASRPSNGTILAAITKGKHGGEAFDREYPERIKATIY